MSIRSLFAPPASGAHARHLTPRLPLLLAAVCLAVAAFGMASQTAHAQCNLGALCGLMGQDPTRSSSIIVSHIDPDPPPAVTFKPVQPDTGEVIEVTASYRLDDQTPDGCICDVRTANASVAVDWTGSSWSAVCTGCGGGGPILGVTICPVDGCGEGASLDYSWTYELVVNLDINHTFNCGGNGHPGALISVEYETTSIDDGDTVRTGDCSLLDPVSPTSQTFTATDNGAFECGYSCTDTTGTSMTITYQ